MHGDRDPHDIPPLSDKDYGGGYLYTGQPNEMWSYGEKAFQIMKKYLKIRLSLKPYLLDLMKEAHQTGAPLMRTMFYEFPGDEKCWDISDQYMFGSKYLVAPVLFEDQVSRKVYLPSGCWENVNDGKEYEGGQTIECSAPIDCIPVFLRK
jgi:alpha-D-xyloside xylohydrolase